MAAERGVGFMRAAVYVDLPRAPLQIDRRWRVRSNTHRDDLHSRPCGCTLQGIEIGIPNAASHHHLHGGLPLSEWRAPRGGIALATNVRQLRASGVVDARISWRPVLTGKSSGEVLKAPRGTRGLFPAKLGGGLPRCRENWSLLTERSPLVSKSTLRATADGNQTSHIAAAQRAVDELMDL
jgi:hypothetical protein